MPPGTAIAESPPLPLSDHACGQLPAVAASEVRRTAWWLWPHLLSLDAPLVAVVWQSWWARAAGVRLAWGQDAILGGGVWLIYLVDRLADTATAAPGSHGTARHAFYQRHQPWMRFLAGAIFLGLAWLAPWRLDTRQFVAGLGLLALAGGYFWLVHLRAADGWARVLPKEAFVAGMFALGTMFFVLGQTGIHRPKTLLAGALFGGLCFFNCALITKWERNFADLRHPASLLNAFPRVTAHLCAGCVCFALLAGICTAAGPWQGGVFLPLAVSAALLAALDRSNARLSIDALRVFADAVLLTPWMCWHLTLHL